MAELTIQRLRFGQRLDQWHLAEARAAPALGPIQISITYVFADVAVDLDNLAKPVLDALKGVVYEDDGQITDVAIRKRNMARDLRIVGPSPVLFDAFRRGREFLYILVEEAPDQELMA